LLGLQFTFRSSAMTINETNHTLRISFFIEGNRFLGVRWNKQDRGVALDIITLGHVMGSSIHRRNSNPGILLLENNLYYSVNNDYR
jgi:hypothetical protein